MRILLIEDDTHTASFIAKGLREDGHAVDHASDGKQGLFLASTEPYDALVLDRMLPGLDGITVLRTLRGAGNSLPILLLTALGDTDHRVEGLRAGADDYLVKPFAFAELSARLDGIIKRNRGSSEREATRLQAAGLELDLLSREARREGRRIELQPREFRLLEYLLPDAAGIQESEAERVTRKAARRADPRTGPGRPRRRRGAAPLIAGTQPADGPPFVSSGG